jgi:hypothetical protein
VGLIFQPEVLKSAENIATAPRVFLASFWCFYRWINSRIAGIEEKVETPI